jgi:hypothetical protein
MQIAATMPVRKSAEGWIVPSQTGPGTYRVSKLVTIRPPMPGEIRPEWLCSSPDWEARGTDCKHVFAVDFAMRREFAPDGTVTEEVKVTYTQEWTSYNRAQCEERIGSCRCWPTCAPAFPSLPRSEVARAFR